MTTHKVLKVDGVFWEPSECRINDICTALEAVSMEGLVPKTSVAKASLKAAFHKLLSRSPLAVRGNTPVIEPLASDVIGFEARKPNRGAEANAPDFCLSVRLKPDGTVEIPKFDAVNCPWLVGRQAQVEQVVTSQFQSEAQFYPTFMVSKLLGRVIASMGGILVRETGGNYFMPPDSLSQFEEFCNHLDQATPAPQVVLYKFDIKPTERSFKHVLQSVKREAEERLKEVEAGLEALVQDDKKQKPHGKKSRMKEVFAVQDLLERYEGILGVDLADMKAMADQVRGAVDAHSVMEFAC